MKACDLSSSIGLICSRLNSPVARFRLLLCKSEIYYHNDEVGDFAELRFDMFKVE